MLVDHLLLTCLKFLMKYLPHEHMPSITSQTSAPSNTPLASIKSLQCPLNPQMLTCAHSGTCPTWCAAHCLSIL